MEIVNEQLLSLNCIKMQNYKLCPSLLMFYKPVYLNMIFQSYTMEQKASLLSKNFNKTLLIELYFKNPINGNKVNLI